MSGFEISVTVVDSHTYHYRALRDGSALSYGAVLDKWREDPEFTACFVRTLRDSPFDAFRWETPPITSATVSREFEFVLVNSPGLQAEADSDTFAPFFASAEGEAVVDFDNLGRDARLVVPTPKANPAIYPHLASFVRGAPDLQVRLFWERVGELVMFSLGDDPLWVSTAGGGVAWVHVRLDVRPKYYRYPPFRAFRACSH